MALTGYATPDDRRQALEAGFNDHPGKPVVPETLIDVLSRLGTSLLKREGPSIRKRGGS